MGPRLPTKGFLSRIIEIGKSDHSISFDKSDVGYIAKATNGGYSSFNIEFRGLTSEGQSNMLDFVIQLHCGATENLRFTSADLAMDFTYKQKPPSEPSSPVVPQRDVSRSVSYPTESPGGPANVVSVSIHPEEPTIDSKAASKPKFAADSTTKLTQSTSHTSQPISPPPAAQLMSSSTEPPSKPLRGPACEYSVNGHRVTCSFKESDDVPPSGLYSNYGIVVALEKLEVAKDIQITIFGKALSSNNKLSWDIGSQKKRVSVWIKC